MSTAQDPAQALRKNLRAFRKRRGMTQAQMGVKSAVGAASISHFETGQRTPTIGTVVKLADALDVTVDSLLGRAPMEQSARIDPVFQQASQSDARTLDTVRRVAAAILAESNGSISARESE